MAHTAIIVDVTDSTYENREQIRAAVASAMARAGQCTVIAFHRSAEILRNPLADLARLQTGRRVQDGLTGHALSKALQLARTDVKPDAAVVITDAHTGIYDVSGWPQLREAQALHRSGCRRIEAVWIPEQQSIYAAESEQQYCEVCNGERYDPRDYLQKAREFMRQLAMGGSVHEGASSTIVDRAAAASEALRAGIDACIPPADYGSAPPPAPRPPEPPLNPGGGGAIFSKGDAMVQSGDTGAGARQMLQDAVAHVRSEQEAAARRYGEDSAEYQRASNSAVRAALDGLNARSRAMTAELREQQLRHHWNMLTQQLEDIADMGGMIDKQAMQALTEHGDFYRQVEGRSSAVFASGKRALHEALAQDRNIAEVSASWQAPVSYQAPPPVPRAREVFVPHRANLSLAPITAAERNMRQAAPSLPGRQQARLHAQQQPNGGRSVVVAVRRNSVAALLPKR